MLSNCKIIFKEKEYTVDEFKQFVLENGIGSLLGDSPSQLATNIVGKLDYSNQDESVSELWARLSREKRGVKTEGFLTKKEVEQELNPSGQLTDYATQREIRYNTYSGIALTGISANFGKTLGYLFEASPITQVFDTQTGEYIDLSTDEARTSFAHEYNTTTVEAVLQQSNRFVVSSRREPTLKAAYRFKIDGADITGFTRSTRIMGTNKATTNIFETIDTIINLAIDNVKEQKLHLLGITNANANVYLTMVGLGVPLNTVSRIFKTPVMSELNNSGKRFDDKLLQAAIDEIIEQYPDLEDVKGSISTETLDAIYTEKISGIDKAKHDLFVLQTLQKLIPVGNEMFDYARTFSVLRGLPNKKWQLDDTINTIEKYSKFVDEKSFTKRINDEFRASVENIFKRESTEYKTLVAGGKIQEAEDLLETTVQDALDDKSIFGSARAEIRAGFVNRVLRHTNNRKLATRSASAFEDTVLLRIPHVMASYRTLLQSQAILNKSFAVYNKVVTDFVKNIIKEASIFTDDSSANVELISKELIKFLSSNLQFTIAGTDMSTEVLSSETFATSSNTYYGKEAWVQKFLHNFAKVRDSADTMTNEFIKALEFDTDSDGLRTVKIVGDKVNDEEVLEAIKEDFLKFAEDDSLITEGYTRKQAAMDLFKYALLSSSMYYERTGFALIFPSNWVVSYSVALDDRLQSVIPNGKAFTDLNLSILKDKFLVQLLANNDKLLSRTIKPLVVKTKKEGSRTDRGYSGVDEIDGKKVYFDLKYPLSYGPESRRLTTHYDGGVYAVISTPGSPNTYYAKIADKPKHRFYDFSLSNMEESLDISRLSSGDMPLIHKGRITANRFSGTAIEPEYEVGTRILVFDKLDPAAKTASVYRITTANKMANGVSYGVQHVTNFDITKEEAAAEKRKYLSMFLEDRLAPTTMVPDMASFIRKQSAPKGVVYLTSSEENIPGTKKLVLPKLSPNITPDEQNAVAKTIITQIQQLDRSVPYYISSKILDALNPFVLVRAKVSEELTRRIGFRDSKQTEEFEVVNEVSKNVELELKRLSLITFNLQNRHKVLFSEEGPHTHTLKLDSSMRRQIKDGDLLWAGADTYFYVNKVREEVLQLTEFREPVFALMDNNNYSAEEFENIYQKTINC